MIDTAQLIVTMRESRGLTQSEAARACGLPRQNFHRWEQGSGITVAKLCAIAKALGFRLTVKANKPGGASHFSQVEAKK